MRRALLGAIAAALIGTAPALVGQQAALPTPSQQRTPVFKSGLNSFLLTSSSATGAEPW